jgi:hypothetical protein
MRRSVPRGGAGISLELPFGMLRAAHERLSSDNNTNHAPPLRAFMPTGAIRPIRLIRFIRSTLPFFLPARAAVPREERWSQSLATVTLGHETRTNSPRDAGRSRPRDQSAGKTGSATARHPRGRRDAGVAQTGARIRRSRPDRRRTTTVDGQRERNLESTECRV